MSGHSKWSTIKRKKGAADEKRGQQFSKLSRMITIAAKEGGMDPEMNFKLRLAIDKAKEINMPSSTIDRAISGASKDNTIIEEIDYEAYGPEGVALLIKVVTDNRNRASSDIKSILTKRGGSVGGPGSVSWMFEPKGLVVVDSKDFSEEDRDNLELSAIDFGADDLKEESGSVEIYTSPTNLHKLSKNLKEAGFSVESADFEMEPKSTVSIEEKDKAERILNLVDELEGLEDVDRVYGNFDIPEEILEKI